VPSILTNEIKNGMSLQINGALMQVVEFQHVKPGKGHAFVRVKLKNLQSGGVIDRTFRPDEKQEQAIIERRDMQYLYRDGDGFVFMDTSTYDQVEVPSASLGETADYLLESNTAVIAFHEGQVIGIDLPASVVLEIAETEPGLKGDRVSGALKPAVLETGKTVQVPLFVNVGDKIKVDTRDGSYLSRANV